MGHYTVTFPNKKKKQVETSIEVDAFSIWFEKQFSLISCIDSSENSSYAWYIDSGATFHMSSVIECFTYLKENGVIQELVLGYDTTKNAIGRGTIIFDREY